MGGIDINTHELATKYGLNGEVVKEETEKLISKILTESYKCEVVAQFNGKPDAFEIYGYPKVKGQLREVKIIPSNIGKKVHKRIIAELTEALYMRAVFKDCETLQGRIRKVMEGTITQIKEGALFVNLHGLSDTFGESTAICTRELQTPKERNNYMKGSVLSFHVSPSIVPVYDGLKPHIEIRLSRNSEKLTEGLIERELLNRCLDVKVKCTRRIAGAYSEVMVSHRIPKDVINHVSDQLKERIIVRW
jgi:hypothetical protein